MPEGRYSGTLHREGWMPAWATWAWPTVLMGQSGERVVTLLRPRALPGQARHPVSGIGYPLFLVSTALVSDERFELHLTGAHHPERPARLASVRRGLREGGQWDRLQHLPFEPASREAIARVHEDRYVERLIEACERGKACIDCPDSAICPRSAEIAMLAAGGLMAAVDAVMAGEAVNAFCAVRPPGHHAEADLSMGFCLLNNVAIAACHLLACHALKRVAIVDFDVHHGNGTQHSFETRHDVLFISLHQHPDTLYPGTGQAEETGLGAGRNCTLNVPMTPGGGDADYLAAFRDKVMPALDRYQPQCLLVSAGFDAASADPLAQMEVTSAGFRAMTDQLVAAAERHCEGRLVSTLEGGYDLESLADAAAGHVDGLLARSMMRR